MEKFQIEFNGQPKLVSAKTVSDLLVELSLEGRKVAVERNRTIVSRSNYAATPVAPGDQIEIVHFVGGG